MAGCCVECLKPSAERGSIMRSRRCWRGCALFSASESIPTPGVPLRLLFVCLRSIFLLNNLTGAKGRAARGFYRVDARSSLGRRWRRNRRRSGSGRLVGALENLSQPADLARPTERPSLSPGAQRTRKTHFIVFNVEFKSLSKIF